ncbi:MAG: VanZ family protein [Alphaproteobacteria bacterium]|nr:VanZ family protein [Alphaproteobacteria bacterium]
MTALLRFIDVHWRVMTALLFIVVTVLSLLPKPVPPPAPGGDKLYHLISYAALMFPAAYVRPPNWIIYVVFFALWGGVIEVLQPFVNRYGDWADFIANGVGVAAGLLLAAAARRWFAST